jgi:hypothetical protein
MPKPTDQIDNKVDVENLDLGIDDDADFAGEHDDTDEDYTLESDEL